MKKTYFNSLLLLKWGVNLSIVVQVGIILLATVAIVATIIDDDSTLQSNWSIAVNQNLSTQSLSSDSEDIFDVALHVTEGTVQFSSSSPGYFFLKILDAVLIVTVTLVVTLLLRRVIISLSNKTPFSLKNANRLRTMSLLIVLITPYKMLQSFVYLGFIKQHITPVGAKFTEFGFDVKAVPRINEILLDIDIDFTPVFVGILVLVIAEIFRMGVELKQDNEAIV